ncbi:glycosyltransferase family 4 protein [uncultured Jatrophihabitans sp.]|uniref:glycosyltransferase family 4 protein n=1 Tax=uncultured Jatrophihabitans sp. TaxID=1610747 RepID=UPI0035C99161
MRHPSLEYLLVGCVAAIVTLLLTPVARRVAIRIGAVAKPRDRDVHAVAIPRMGGVAIFAGFALALFVASRLPTLGDGFKFGPDMGWIVGAGAVICGIGVLDDIYELDSLTKLAGQALATGLMVIKGDVQLDFLPLVGSTLSFDRNLGVPVTILLTLLIINALNFIDGLDGLAAGVCTISAVAFFVFSYHLAQEGFTGSASPPTLLAAALAGTCIGFLPHNFFPAKIFMGDSGSMLVGLMLSAAATTSTTTTDSQVFNDTPGSLAIFLPLIVPLSVLALPFVDLLLAVVRRVARGRSPFAPDKQHLHHRLLEIGHSHRRAVLLLYFWSAVVAFAGVGVSFEGSQWFVLWLLVAFVVLGLAVSLVPNLRRQRTPGPAVAGATRHRDRLKAGGPTRH